MSQTLAQIAALIGAELHGDPGCVISGVAPLQLAEGGQLSFLADRRYRRFLPQTRATAVVLAATDAADCPVASLVVSNPYLGYVKVIRLLFPEPGFAPGVDANAAISDSASIAASAHVGPMAVIGETVSIGARSFIGPGCVIGDGVAIGEDCRLVARVTLCAGVRLGNRVQLHPGVVIGADGFGLANDAGTWVKIPQLGSVLVEDDVEVGANTTIDRGALENTIIERGVKIDNLVQIGHNVRVGEDTAIAGCTAIAGSVHIGKRCMIGGASAIAGHLSIADGVVITGMSGINNTIREAGVFSGAMVSTDNATWRRNMARVKRLDELFRRVLALEERTDAAGAQSDDDGQT